MKFYYFILLYLFFSMQALGQHTLDSITLSSEYLHITKKIWIYKPLLSKSNSKKFSVLYMHDAQNLFDSKKSFSGEWNIDETLDSLHAQTIVVGIEHGNANRINELTPYKNEKYGGGNADAYLEFIVTVVKPYIDSHYSVKVGKNHTGIMGSSLGGLLSYYAILKYPEIFGKAGVFSPAFWINKKEIIDLTEKTKDLDAKLYFMCGDHESENMVSDCNEIIHLVNTKRCTCKMLTKKVIITGGEHNEKLWREQFAKAYLWLF